MHVKNLLLAFLLIFATVTTVVTTVVVPSSPTTEHGSESITSDFVVYDEVEPLGEEKGGGWGLQDKA